MRNLFIAGTVSILIGLAMTESGCIYGIIAITLGIIFYGMAIEEEKDGK